MELSPSFKGLSKSRRFPTSTGLWVSAVWIVHCYYKTIPNCHRSKNALLRQTILYYSTIRSQKVPLQGTKNIHKTRHDWTCTPLIKNKMGPLKFKLRLGTVRANPCKNRPKSPIRGRDQKIKIALLLQTGRL